VRFFAHAASTSIQLPHDPLELLSKELACLAQPTMFNERCGGQSHPGQLKALGNIGPESSPATGSALRELPA